MASLSATVSTLSLLADETRLRLLALLREQELNVMQLADVLGMPQPRVSTHLGKLREAGLVRDRREGVSIHYRAVEPAPAPAQELLPGLLAGLDDRILASDKERARLALARAQGRFFLDSVAGALDRHYSPGRTWEATLRGLVGLMRLGAVLDVGAGDGVLAELLAPRAERYVCVDKSARMLEAATRRLSAFSNVELVEADASALPFAAHSFDTVLCFNALVYAEEPAQLLVEAARVLRPGGTLLLVTVAEHGHADVTSSYGHVHLGFAPAALADWLERAGLQVESCAVTSRERRAPHFDVVTALARARG